MTDIEILLDWIMGHWLQIVFWAAVFDLFITAPAYFLIWRYVIKPKTTEDPAI